MGARLGDTARSAVGSMRIVIRGVISGDGTIATRSISPIRLADPERVPWPGWPVIAVKAPAPRDSRRGFDILSFAGRGCPPSTAGRARRHQKLDTWRCGTR
jgi:hypothetical protein